MPTLPADRLARFSRELFAAAGVPADEAALVADSLVASNLAGHDSHGVIRVVQYARFLADGLLRGGVTLKILARTPAVLSCDADWGLGQVQAHRLLDHLIPMARELGLAAGTLKHCGHVGRLGEYGERAAGEGLALFATVNNHGFGRAVAPPGGTRGVIATNPICLAVPSGEGPIVLDIGTSVCAEGKVRVCYNKGTPTPEGWLVDHRGQPTTDPRVLYHDPRGSIRPLGGEQAYKGFGLGLLLDMLAGGLSGAPCSRPEIEPRSANAMVMALFDPERFAGMAHFRREVDDLIANVRSCPTSAPDVAITLPGDPERRERQRRAAGLTLDEGTWGQLVELAGRLGVEVPS